MNYNYLFYIPKIKVTLTTNSFTFLVYEYNIKYYFKIIILIILTKLICDNLIILSGKNIIYIKKTFLTEIYIYIYIV